MIVKSQVLVFLFLNLILASTKAARIARQTYQTIGPNPIGYSSCGWGWCLQGTSCGYRYFWYGGSCSGVYSCPTGTISCSNSNYGYCCPVSCSSPNFMCNNPSTGTGDSYCCPPGTGCCPSAYNSNGGLCCTVQPGNPNQCPTNTSPCRTPSGTACCTIPGSCGTNQKPCCSGGSNAYSSVCYGGTVCNSGNNYCTYGKK